MSDALARGAHRALQELRHMIAKANHGRGRCRRQKLAVIARNAAALIAAAGVAVERTDIGLLLLLRLLLARRRFLARLPALPLLALFALTAGPHSAAPLARAASAASVLTALAEIR